MEIHETLPTPEIQSLQNPFRDWNKERFALHYVASLIQSLQNPFRDWNFALRCF